MKRTIVLSLVLASALSANAARQAAQQPNQPPAGSNWQHVQMLPKGTSIYVYSRTSHQRCDLAAIDADTLTCVHGKDIVFQRTEIKSIKLAHRGRSSWVGLAVGTGAGIGIGYAIPLSKSSDPVLTVPTQILNAFSRVVLVGFGAASGATAGSLTGFFTDFTRSTVYKAP
jgi:hypothetical protein